MAKVIIVIDEEGNSAQGETLEKALEHYNKEVTDVYDNEDFNKLTWFEAEQFYVKQKLVKVEKLVLTKTK